MVRKVLFIQFANSMYLRHDECDRYWDTFYRRWHAEGYYMGRYVFEPPKWIAEICHFLTDDMSRAIQWVTKSIDEAVETISLFDADYVLMSLMNANQTMIEGVVKRCPFQKFLIGGYNDKYLQYLADRYPGVTYCRTTVETAQKLGVQYRFGTDYSLMEGDTVIPRLTLSYGCRNNCKFCIVPHGLITEVPRECVEQQVFSFRDLDYRLIYIDDKTFMQAGNHVWLKDLSDVIRNGYGKKDFNGFVVQTTSGIVAKNAEHLADLGVRVAEIGLETYNDQILRAWRKPSSEQLVDKAVKAAKEAGLLLIPNIIVGLPEETEETYQRTFDYVMPLLKNGDIIGINPAIFTDYDNDGNLGEIDFLPDGKEDLHRRWWTKFNATAADILEKNLPKT